MSTASTIKDLLASKHSNDVFVTECKDGPSCSGMLKLDAWAMKRSWAHPCYYGYEIKVSRADFLSDTKWPGYLDYCNEFSFVCPKGVIQPNEVAESAGLLIVASTGTRLFTKKKAPHRDIPTPELLLQYILMARTQITKSTYYSNTDTDQTAYWRQWLDDKTASLHLGTQCAEKLRKSYETQVYNVERDMKILRRENEALQTIKKFCTQIGVDPHNWDVEKAVEAKVTKLPPHIRRTATQLKESIKQFLDEYENTLL